MSVLIRRVLFALVIVCAPSVVYAQLISGCHSGDSCGSQQAGSLILNGGTSGSTTVSTPLTSGSNNITLPTSPTNGYYIQTNGSGVWSYAAVSGGGGPVVGGRLTLQSGHPVQTQDESAQTTIYYDTYKGNQVTTGGTALTIGSDEISMGLSTSNITSGDVYDVFGVSSSGSLVICAGPAWSSTTSRGTGSGTSQLQLSSGLWTNENSLTHCYGGSGGTTDYGSVAANAGTYLGSFYAVAAGEASMVMQPAAASGGSAPCMCLYNAYNRVLEEAADQDSTSNWTYTPGTSNAWRNADNSASNKVTVLDGLQQSPIFAAYQTGYSGDTGTSVQCHVGIEFNSTAPTLDMNQKGSSSVFYPVDLGQRFVPALGLSVLTAQETNTSTSTACLYGSTALAASAVGTQLSVRLEN